MFASHSRILRRYSSAYRKLNADRTIFASRQLGWSRAGLTRLAVFAVASFIGFFSVWPTTHAALPPSATDHQSVGVFGNQRVGITGPAHFAGAAVVSAIADANATPIYSQPSDGRAVESSSKIQGGTQYDREVADDFDLNATITRAVVRGSRGGYNMPPNPVYYGVYVRFYDGTQGRPGALQVEHFLTAGTPGIVFDAAQPNTFDITLPTPFNASGRHFLSVQPVFGGSETWGVSSGNYPNVRGSVWFRRDRAAGEPWTESIYANQLHDMSFDLFGTLLSAPRIDTVSANPIPRSGLLRITGANFGATQGGSQLTIDGKASTFIAHWADNLIVAYVPETSALGTVSVSLTTESGTTSTPLNVTTRPTDGRIRWRFTVAGDYVPRRAAVGPDGTVYINEVRGRLFALTPDGGLKWVLQAGLVGAMGPVSVGADGTVYLGGLVPKDPGTTCSVNSIVNVEGIFAINPDGTQKWLFNQTCDGLLSGPNVGPDGKIHAVTDSVGIGAFALNADGSLAHAPTGRFGVDGSAGTEIVFGPAVPGQAATQKYFQYESGGLFGYTLDGQRVFLYATNAVGTTQPVAGQQTGTVYTVPDHQTAGRLFAVSPQGTLRWTSPIQPISNLSIPDAPPSESAVYIVQDGGKLHRVNPADGSVVWTFVDNNEQLFDPIASPDDRLVLMGGRVGFDLGFFEAVSSSGRQLWKQHLPNEPGLGAYGQVRASNRARFTADGQTAYIAADVAGDNSTAANPVYSFFYALDTSDNDAPINQPPRVTITSPANNLEVSKRTTLDIKASVQDDGTIDRVEFFYGTTTGVLTLINTDTTPDADGFYSTQFTPTAAGSHSFVAVAYDTAGLSGKPNSSTNVWVTERPPIITWMNPTDGSTFAAPTSLTLTAKAADSDGAVTKVEFSRYQSGIVGSVEIGSDTTPDGSGNYQTEWTNPPQGTYELTALATDNSGLTKSAVITVTIGPAAMPKYSITGTVRDSDGIPLSGVQVALVNSLINVTGIDGVYVFSDLQGGGSYSVAASLTGYSFSPPQHVFNGLGANQTANFTATRNTHVVSGLIKDSNNVGLSGVALTVSGGETTKTFYSSTNGNYAFSLPAGGNYTITPSLVNYTFAPVNQSLNNLAADQTANFIGTRNTHGISGRVVNSNGYALSGISMILTGSQTDTATTDLSGNYSFNLSAGGTYTVTPSHSGYTFSPASLNFSSLSGNVTGSFTATSTNQRPQVTVTSPTNNATFAAPATITVSADANDADGTIRKVEFFAEYRSGAFQFETISLGSDTTAPYSTTFTYSGADSFNLRAVATDDRADWTPSEPVVVTFTLDAASQTPGWQKQFATTRPGLNGAPFETLGFSAVSERHAWASHLNAKVSRTIDGGLTWETVEVAINGGNNNHAQDVDFVDTQTGWVVGGEDNAVLRSTDGDAPSRASRLASPPRFLAWTLST